MTKAFNAAESVEQVRPEIRIANASDEDADSNLLSLARSTTRLLPTRTATPISKGSRSRE